jgi:hypothetical protein
VGKGKKKIIEDKGKKKFNYDKEKKNLINYLLKKKKNLKIMISAVKKVLRERVKKK